MVTAIVKEHQHGCVVVDFDETLLLANSTELYLNSAQPRHLSALISKSVVALRPWRFLDGEDKKHLYQDMFRILAVTILMPWTYFIWRWHHAGKIAQKLVNRNLVKALSDCNRQADVIVSLGYRFVIKPITDNLMPESKLIASDLSIAQTLRRNGKIAQTAGALDCDIRDAIVITDSRKDEDLLQACGTGILIQWPDTVVKAAHDDLYYPFMYTNKVKRPGSKYVSRAVILTDAIAVGLAYAWFSATPILCFAAICILQLSVWTIYELGYFENDKAASREMDGKIPPTFALYGHRMSEAGAWMAATCFTVVGMAVLSIADPLQGGELYGDAFRVAKLSSIWMAFLAVGRAVFAFYNRLEGEIRVFIYPLLQIFRVGGYGLILTTGFVGAALISSLILSRWIPYVIYRAANVRWYATNKVLLVTLFAVLLFIGFLAGNDETHMMQAIVISGWLSLKAARELIRTIKTARFIDSKPGLAAIVP